MKKTVLVTLFALMGLTSAWAYDFSAVAPTGQTLYYNITSSSERTVSVTYQHPIFYWFESEPTGSLIIPSTVIFNDTTYTVTAIGGDAFDNCDSLTSVTIPSTVTSIGEYAFFDCGSLTSVTIPSSVTTIESGAFSSCFYLLDVLIPNSVTTIEDNAFASCVNLMNLTIPDSVTTIGDNAFYLVRNIIYHGTATGSPWGALGVNAYEEGDLFYADSTKTHLVGCKIDATSVTIPNTVTSIGNSTFSPCYELTSVTIPNTVTSIGEYAFNGCNNLANITIPNIVTFIGAGAFAYCSQFTSITIPNTVTTIEDETFMGCSGLTSVTIPNNVTSIGEEAFIYCNRLTNIVIPNFVTSIGSGAFRFCYSLESVTIGSSVTSIGSGAFLNCSRIAEIMSRSTVAPTLGENVFNNVHDTIPVYIPCGSSESYNTQWTYFSNFEETFAFSFQVESSDTVQGSVTVLQQPTCESSDAVVQAIPASGYRFDHWSNGETQNPYTLTVTSDTLITAVFSPQDPVSINDVMRTYYEVSAEQGTIVVKDAEGENVRVFDVAGRLHYQGLVATEVWRLGVSNVGLYFVQIGQNPAQKVVVVR